MYKVPTPQFTVCACFFFFLEKIMLTFREVSYSLCSIGSLTLHSNTVVIISPPITSRRTVKTPSAEPLLLSIESLTLHGILSDGMFIKLSQFSRIIYCQFFNFSCNLVFFTGPFFFSWNSKFLFLQFNYRNFPGSSFYLFIYFFNGGILSVSLHFSCS